MHSLASTKTQSWLLWFFKGVLILGAAVLITRLVELQIIKGNYFHALADDNRERRVPIIAPRGKILARGGEVLVGNKEVKKKVEFDPKEGFTKVDAQSSATGDDVITEFQREYLLGTSFAHASGILGQVATDEIGKVDPKCTDKGPRTNDVLVGRGGLEQQYDCHLRGINGEELVEVDTMGKRVRTLGNKDPIGGSDIHTTIDYGLQKKVANLIDDKKGAIIVSDSHGQILAFYSSPSFDPNIFVTDDPKNREKIKEVLTDPNLPLFNRILSGTYHPGSIFKLAVSTAALEDGIITNDFTYSDPGVITIDKFSYNNWLFSQYGKTEGTIDLTRAIARSTDTFFYKIGEMVGVEKMAEWANKFGLSAPTGIDLPGEATGIIPTREWKWKTKNEAWFLGNTYHMSIGQGDVTATPLAAHMMTTVIANSGQLCKPFLVSPEDLKSLCHDLEIKKSTITEIKKGMIGACTGGGTAFPFFDVNAKLPDNKKVACKTGTAETDEKNKTHAWFSVFYPSEFPEIVITVLVEKGGEGSSVAAPIAKEIFDYWIVNRPN